MSFNLSLRRARVLLVAVFTIFYLPLAVARVDCFSAPVLPEPAGMVVEVSSTSELMDAIGNLQAGTTILLAPGDYPLSSTLYIRKDNVTLRGDSTRCDAVRLIGRGMENDNYGDVSNGIWTDATGLKVQNLGISDVYYHGINYNPGAESPVIYNVRLENTGQQFVKANPASFGDGVDDGIVEYSIFEYTDGPPSKNHGGGTGYTNGVDVHAGKNWVIRNNVFKGFHTPDSADNLWNPAILMWNGARDTVAENNTFINVDRAIAFGLVDRSNDHSGGIVRNNMVFFSPNLYSAERRAASDGAIILWDSPRTKVYHNTVLANGNLNKAIELRFDMAGAEVMNNLIDAPVVARNEGGYVKSGNITDAEMNWFVDPSSGNLRLRADVLNELRQVSGLSDASRDVDGQTRNVDGMVFPGADEPLVLSPPNSPSNVRVD